MELQALEQNFAALQVELKTHFEKAAEQEKQRGSVTQELKTQITNLQTQLDGIDKKMVEKQTAAGAEHKTIEQDLRDNDDVARLIRDGRGRALIKFKGANAAKLWERKTIIDSGLGYPTPGVLEADRVPGIVREPQRTLTVRNALSARPTALPMVYWVKVNAPLISSPAMMQTQGAVKYEDTVTFTPVNSTVRTIASFVKASRQALDDFAELAGLLQTDLPYYVNRQEETQLLSGDNTNENLNGLITQAAAFNTGLLSNTAGWTRIDVIAAAIQQIAMIDELPPTFVILNRQDWWNIRRTKDSYGRYILGDPQSVGNPTLWDLTPIPTNSIASGTFLVGSGDPAASEIRDRMEMEVMISTEDSDNFQRNIVTIRAEKRMCLTVKRPNAYVTGTFTTSP